ncbi:hypothetical protein RER_40660 [Rhodococcus erythropolis PR4]|uniref:Uncharacterized protein n=1 Tax=Rhodococcus erythropolis (strain PR4 / NBRC 100887) TaxID=234621 RepID=C1A2D9_RHOE4|nr:hypothetical protein EN35_28765 [Rhodococcus qingshengii]BAH34774.1 hypothetical protein RER_40660 [Rhodococcus erythropolis PR4]
MFPGTRQVRASAYTLRSPAGEGRRNADWSGTTLSTHYSQLQLLDPEGRRGSSLRVRRACPDQSLLVG